MSQHDFVIANATFPNTRTDLNAALQALASTNKGSAAPSTIYAGEQWIDEDTPSSTVWTWNFYDGTDSIDIGQFDITNNLFKVALDYLTTRGDLLVRGASAPDRLAIGSANNLLTTDGTDPAWDSVSDILDAVFASARGSMLTRKTSAWDDLAPGTAGYFLQSAGAGADLLWAEVQDNLVQRVRGTRATVGTGTTVVPLDDTIPQNSEGDEYLTQAITPTSATNILRIRAVFYASHSVGTVSLIMSLFQDTTAGALATSISWNPSGGNSIIPLVLEYEMVAGTTSATTFKIRIGSDSAGTTTVNGKGGSRQLGGRLISGITIEEVKP